MWTPTAGQTLRSRKDERREANDRDEYVIGTCVEAENELVTHVTSFIRSFRAHKEAELFVKVSGSFRARTPSRAIAEKFEEEVLRMKELCSHMDISVHTFRKISLVL